MLAAIVQCAEVAGRVDGGGEGWGAAGSAGQGGGGQVGVA